MSLAHTGTGPRPLAVVRPVASGDLEPLVDLLTAAFARTSIGHHLVSDDRTRRQVLRGLFRIIVPHAMATAQVEVIDDGGALAGAAIWNSHLGPSLPPIPGYAIRLAEATGPHLGRFVDLDTARTRHHPAGPHHHLAYLAVHPNQHGRGLGSRLLEHHHQLLDTQHLEAVIDGIGARDSRLLVRHGYDPGHPYPAGPGAPHLYPMRRHPRT